MSIPSPPLLTDAAASGPVSAAGLAWAGLPPAEHATAWIELGVRTVEDAILRTVVYADLFDFPLTVQEMHRFLIGFAAPTALVEERLAGDGRLRELVHSTPPLWFLAGRDSLVELRRERDDYSRKLWPLAWRYGRLMAGLPFVRLVALTGSLAMNNVRGPRDDIDFLVATVPGRTWLARALIIAVVRLASRQVQLCPNYVMAEHRLQLGEPSLFTAHELAQMIPLFGEGLYRQLLSRNAWVTQYLPNSLLGRPPVRDLGRIGHGAQRLAETPLKGRLGDLVERWERVHKIPRLRHEAARRGGGGALFTPELCKGHMDDHAALVYQRYVARLASRTRN